MEERADTSQTAGFDDRGLSSGTPRSLCRRPVSRRRVIEELDGNSEVGGYDGDATTRQYTWGLDLAAQAGSVNSLEQAGGIGGLLAAYDTAGTTTTTTDDRTFLYFYDANGNVGQVVETTTRVPGTIVAHYEYTPYGQRLNAPAAGEYDQPYLFSTKPFDSWTGLGYWGYRWYSPQMGRWVNRDPIGEKGGANLYGYAANAPSLWSDAQGRALMVFIPRIVVREGDPGLDGTIGVTFTGPGEFECYVYPRGWKWKEWAGVPFPASCCASIYCIGWLYIPIITTPKALQAELEHLAISRRYWDRVRALAEFWEEQSRKECWTDECARATCAMLKTTHFYHYLVSRVEQEQLEGEHNHPQSEVAAAVAKAKLDKRAYEIYLKQVEAQRRKACK